MDNFDIFKQVFRDELTFLFSIDTDDEVFEIAESIFENEKNYNNADITSSQYIWSLDGIENFCHIIYGIEGF